MAKTGALKKAVLALLMLAVLMCLSLAWFIYSFLTTAPGSGREMSFLVHPGTPLQQVAQNLERAGLVSDARLFVAYAQRMGAADKIQAGEYMVSDDMKPADLLDKLTSGDVVVHKVTVPEGYNLRQIGAAFENAGIADWEEFDSIAADPVFRSNLGIDATSLEGYLFPDTYHWQLWDESQTVVRAMAQRLNQIYTPQHEARARELGMSRHQVLTLASLIEKETGIEQERPLISAVFHARIDKGIPLACDPSVIYGIKNFDGNLTRMQLRDRGNRYNTYVHKGLPPGPICSPGLKSIEAALYPADVKYLYFVSRNDGSHHFSATLAEHNRAVQLYQRTGARGGTH